MTISPPGAQLADECPPSTPYNYTAPIDLPPPPPSSDPREPSPTATRGRATRTPQRPRSPMASRGTSPTRMAPGSAPSLTERASDPPGGLAQPVPRPLGSSPPIPGSSPPGLGGSGSPSSITSGTSGGLIGATSPPHAHHHGHHHPHPHHPHLSRPSSPSSIHSSTSAIFERDIELPPVASLSLNPNQTPSHTLSHKSSRLSSHQSLSHGSALDHAVPAVLDDAVEALHTGTNESPANNIHGLEIESAAPAGGIGMARQSSASIHGGARKVSTAGGVMLNSRSPSPVSIHSGASSMASPTRSPPILGKLSTQPGSGLMSSLDNMSPTSGGSGASGSGVLRPQLPTRTSTGPQVPGGWNSGPTDALVAEGVSPGTQPRPEDLTSAAAAAAATDELNTTPSPPPLGHGPAPHLAHGHLGSTSGKDKRRISYISYNDLLLSVPTTITPLADITSGNLSPDHLPGTISPSVSTLSPVVPAPIAGVAGAAVSPGQTPTPGTGNLGTLGQAGSSGLVREISGDTERRVSGSWEAGAPGSRMGLGLGDGEWGRHGLGRGLEQRLEDLAQEEGKQ